MAVNKKLVHYCVGCGLCQALHKAELNIDSKGFSYPYSGDTNWLDSICPIGHLPINNYDFGSIWGRAIDIYFGWSNNSQLRNRASSGGMISEIAIYLLESKIVDGIIHISANTEQPTENLTEISYSAEEIVSKCGSRYSISHPLDIIGELDTNKRYAFIGKPCDVVALRNYQRKYPVHGEIIPILISFFCMGIPSVQAQEKLLSELGSDSQKCKSLSYRGNGWPGSTTVVNKDGSFAEIDYGTCWGKILGRDLMPACRFCIDGVGEAADISCGDAWYVGENGMPDFTEHDGRNIVFARTPLGADVLRHMADNKSITLEMVENAEAYLAQSQPSQFFRRASMKSRIGALRIMQKPYPHYPKEMLNKYGRHISFLEHAKMFYGTCKRIMKGII